MTEELSDILRAERLTSVVDIGANPIDGAPPYKAMLSRGLCRVIGFEPQAEALSRLNHARGPHEQYLPYAVGDGDEHMLRICSLEGMTSLLVPDPERLALFNLFPAWATIKSEIPIETRRLDDVAEIAEMDFLKMDVQGSELNILKNGREKLAQAVAIQTEVSFVPLYKGQPSFGETDLALRELGFIPHCFAELKIWPLSPLVVENAPNKGIRQLLEADLLYVRDFTKAENMTGEQWKHLALIAHYCYGSTDLALRAVIMAGQLGVVAPNCASRYVDSFAVRT